MDQKSRRYSEDKVYSTTEIMKNYMVRKNVAFTILTTKGIKHIGTY